MAKLAQVVVSGAQIVVAMGNCSDHIGCIFNSSKSDRAFLGAVSAEVADGAHGLCPGNVQSVRNLSRVQEFAEEFPGGN
jgi:hypothetical protein